MEGILLSGEKTKLRTIVSDPRGQSHLTAVGVFLITEAILGLGSQSDPQKGGIYLPETILSTVNIIARLKELDVNFIEDIV